MSGIIKGIGKVFKKVVKVVKKVAIPALAIGAVVLTGGAALGVLPSIGALGSSLGLSSALTGILSSAATGATIGAGGALLTGGNIVKGATTGFITGGAVGGIGAAMGGGTAATAAGAASPGGALSTTPVDLASSGMSVSGLRSAAGIGAQAASSPFAAPALSGGLSLPAAATSLAPGAIPATAGNGLSRVFGALERNPLLAAGVVQGIGAGLSASAQAKDARRRDEEIRASYDGVGDNLYQYAGADGGNYQDALSRFSAPIYGRVQYDRQTGRIVPVGA